jgi:formylglycine-generating enzyme required for sulfatase activity
MRGVSFYEALAYCKWLFMISNHPFSLPNEAQWEKAARGTDKRPWATGVNPGTAVVDVKDGSRERENPRNCGITGSESPYGCMDMVGQVWNWTVSIDTMHRFEPSKQENILDDVFAPRMIRGGSWKAGPAKAYAYHRESQLPVPADYPEEIGFRLVTSKDPTGLDIP